MKLFITFDPNEDLIYLTATIVGPKAMHNVRFALDNGAAITIVHSNDLTAIGYDLDSIDPRASIVTATKPESEKALVVEKIQEIDQVIENFDVICHDLPPESGVDGVLGLNFLRHFDTDIRYSNNTLTLMPLLPF